jgi:hypothetical protein
LSFSRANAVRRFPFDIVCVDLLPDTLGPLVCVHLHQLPDTLDPLVCVHLLPDTLGPLVCVHLLHTLQLLVRPTSNRVLGVCILDKWTSISYFLRRGADEVYAGQSMNAVVEDDYGPGSDVGATSSLDLLSVNAVQIAVAFV